MNQRFAFAVPGDINRLTGGTIYDRRVIDELRKQGMDVTHIELPDSFPDPSSQEMQTALAQLSAVPADVPLIIDGLAFGALDPAGVAQLQAPLVPLVHHPLAEESGLTDNRRTYLHQTEQRNLQKALHVMVPSPHTAAILTECYAVNDSAITIARPGTDKPSIKANPANPPVILSVGIQVPRKGHDVLIKALAQLQDLDWTATIAGAPVDPVFAEELAMLVETLGLQDRLKLAGQVQQKALQQIYTEASIFALATRYEGYGIVFDEALAHGLPIVSCATGAVPDTVPGEVGLLAPPDDPDAFASVLRNLLTDDDLRTSKAKAAQVAGEALPGWHDTATIFTSVLKTIAVEPVI